MKKKKENYYFESLIEMVEYSCEAAKMIKKVINDYDYKNISELKTKMHYIEHSADIRKHITLEKLAKEFITPIETEDIIQIAQAIDNVTDSIEDILLRLYMYNVKEIHQGAIKFVDTMSQCVFALKEVIVEFQNFKKPERIKELIVEVNHLEENGDEIYINVIKKLFENSDNPIELFIWEDIFYRFEKCCDNCEDVADAIETVIMKNS